MQNCTFQNFSQLLPEMMEKCQELNEIFNFTISECLILLNYFKWNDYALNDYLASCSDFQEILFKSGAAVQIKESINDTLCPICVTNQIQIKLNCSHSSCEDCFDYYIQDKLKVNSFIKCFYQGCNQIIPYSFYEENKKYFNRYQIRLCKDFYKNYKCCKSEECDYYIKSNPKENIIQCLCGVVFCIQCDYGDHRPLTCQQCLEWIKIYQQQVNILDFVKQGKFCPKCSQLIEKDRGCNHMTCKKPLGCGFEFCWICMDSWSSHSKETGGYYNCNKYSDDVNDKKNQLQKNKQNQRLIFYAVRYLGHEKGEQIARKKKNKFFRAITNVKLENSLKDLLKNCYNYIIQARISLKWTYAYGYFMKKQQPMFEFGQADFERYCENLHSLLENEIYHKIKHKQSISEYQQKILNYYKMTQQFQSSFLKDLQQLD